MKINHYKRRELFVIFYNLADNNHGMISNTLVTKIELSLLDHLIFTKKFKKSRNLFL